MMSAEAAYDFDPDESSPSIEELRDAAPRCTDSANADAFVSEHGRGYLFVVQWEAWLAWDGKRWCRDGARARVVNAAMLTARAEHYRAQGRLRALEERHRQAMIRGQKDEDLEAEIAHEKRLLKWHEQSQNGSRLEAVAKLLETRLVVHLRDLDRDPWLLNVRNGTIDLRTATLRPHDQTDRLTQLCDVEWDDEARCPTWQAFVESAMCSDLQLALYLQRLVGYSITALTTEHVLAFFYGGGRNGKSTFVQTLRTMLGEYACAAPRDLLFEDKAGQRHPAELARLYGKRLAICAEIGEHTTLDEAKVKDLTGGDTVAVRRMREDFWDLEPTHTLFLSGNHKPTVRGDDLGIWRRIRLIPWLVTVDDGAVDIDLPTKLRAELPGILRWAVHGCLEWQRNGLAEPAIVLEATREYRAESDVLGEFLAQHVVFGSGHACSREALRARYEAWCEESGHHPYGAKKLGQRLRERGVESTKVREGVRVKNGWKGCRMKSDYELQCEAEPDEGHLS
jgi:putative DNA primase/helicase